jgi:predicted Fe-Mo cluster-binding NifX family protein
MRIAVSSQNFRTVTGHAGTARRFIVFEADQQTSPREIERLDLDANMAIHGFDHSAGHPLDSMNVLITGSAGEGFVRHLATRGVLVVATNEINPARAVEAYLDGRVRSPSTGCNHDHGKADGKKHTHDSRGDEACSCQG